MLICSPWPINATCSGGIPVDPAARTPDQASAVLAASELLWLKTGQIFTECPVEAFPCKLYCRSRNVRGWGFYPHIFNGVWYNSCPCSGNCGDGPTVRLPGPVVSITEVRVDGVIVPPADYHLTSPDLLVRDNGGSWPTCGDMEVDYIWGTGIPESGVRAVSLLAAQLLDSCSGGVCRTNQTEVGQTGIAEVDNWVQAVNPNGLTAFPFVLEDDLIRQIL